MKRTRRNQLLCTAAGVAVSGAFTCAAHAQAIFTTQDDFNSWLIYGNNNNPVNPLAGSYNPAPGGTIGVGNAIDTDGSAFNGLGGTAQGTWDASNNFVGGALQPGVAGAAGSLTYTVNAQNAATNPGSAYWNFGLSQNLIGQTDLTRALAGADQVSLDYTAPVDNSGLTAGAYYETKLLFNFDGNYNQEDVNGPAVNHGSYLTASYANPFIQVPGQTFLQIGGYFNSNFNATGPVSVTLDNFRVVAPQWVKPGGGDWNNVLGTVDANWWTGITNAAYAGTPIYENDTGLAPNFQGIEADFLGGDPGNPLGVNPIVTTAITVNVGTIVLNNTASSYTLAAAGAGGNITINQPGTEPGLINDLGGTHTISAPVILASSLIANVANLGDTLHISGAMSGTGGLTVTGGGVVSLESATNTYGTSTTVQGGNLIAKVTGSLPNLTNLTNNGTATILGNQTLASLTGTGTLVVGNGTANTVKLNNSSGLATAGGLTIGANSMLDIANNHMILSYGASDPASAVYNYLKTGFNAAAVTNPAAWTGPGINSSVANLAANRLNYGVGFVDGKDGVPGASVTSGQILIAYALYGDLNLDNLVNATDFAVFGVNFNTAQTGWDKGDFLYNGLINASDFALLGTNFGKAASGVALNLPASDFAALDAFAAANGLSLPSVPEPASLGLLTAGALGMLARRRRRSS